MGIRNTAPSRVLPRTGHAFIDNASTAHLARLVTVLLPRGLLLRCALSELLLVLLQNTRGQSLEDPLVIEAFFWGQPFEGVPLEALSDQVHELRIWHLS